MNHSLGGGTGSGLGALILEQCAVDYRKKSKIGFEVLAGDPNGKRHPCETYNQLLSMHHLLDHTNVSYVFDNARISSICTKRLDRVRPTYEHVNSLLAKVISGVTGHLRFGDGDL